MISRLLKSLVTPFTKKNMINIIAKPTTDGYTFTLSTYALKYLLEAETLYGERTKDYIFGGVELNENGPPKVWYPYSKFVVIQVSQSTSINVKQAIFQIAHEVVHVISPNGLTTTNNLEEGLSTYFSKVVTDRDTSDVTYAMNSITPTKYFYPYELVTKLIIARPDAIKELRKIQPIIGKITKQDFQTAGLNIDESLIDELVKPMDYGA